MIIMYDNENKNNYLLLFESFQWKKVSFFRIQIEDIQRHQFQLRLLELQDQRVKN